MDFHFTFKRVYRVIHQTLQVRFFFNLCTIFKDIKLKIVIDDLQHLEQNTTEAKNNDSTTVSVMTTFIVISRIL